MRDVRSYGGLYDLRSEEGVALLDGTGLSSFVANLRDLGSPGASDFLTLGPGSQVWFLGYSIRLGIPPAAPADVLGLTLTALGSYDQVAPFTFGAEQSIILPVYDGELPGPFAGKLRMEAPAAQLTLLNLTGVTLTVSFQYWAKGF